MGLQTSLDSDMSSMGSKSDSESESSCDTIVTQCDFKQNQSDVGVNVNCSEASSSDEQLILSASKLTQIAHNRDSRGAQATTKIATELELSQDGKGTQADLCPRYFDNEMVPSDRVVDQCKSLHSSPQSKRMQAETTSMRINPENPFHSSEQARGFTQTEPKLVCVSQRLKEYFESLKTRRQEKSQSLYQFFKSVRTELVASLLFALITSQALITLRSSNLFRVGDEMSKFRLDTSQRAPKRLESLVPTWDRTGVQVSYGLVLSLTVATMTQIFGHVSGCHLAPSVSLALYAKGHISAVRLGSYVLAQATGPLLGLTLLNLLTSSHLDGHEIDAILAPRATGGHSDMKGGRRTRRQVEQNYDAQEFEKKINNSDLNRQQTSYQATRVDLFGIDNGEASGQQTVSDEQNGAKSEEYLMMTKNKSVSESDRELEGDQSRISGHDGYLSGISATHTQGIESLLISIENHANELRKAGHRSASSTEPQPDRPINRTLLPAHNGPNTTTGPSSKIANRSAMIASWEAGQDRPVELERAITIPPAAITTTTDREIAASQVVGEIEFNNNYKQPTGCEKVGASSIAASADRERALNSAINADAASQTVTTEPRIKRPWKPSKPPLSSGSVYHAPRRMEAPRDSASESMDSKHDARSKEQPIGEHPSSQTSSRSQAFIQTRSPSKLQIRRSTGSQSSVVGASSNGLQQALVVESNGLPGNQSDVDSKPHSINLLELALPDSIMPTDTMSQCILAASAKNSDYKRDSETRFISPAPKLSTGSENDEAASLFHMCLSRTNSSQMFLYQFLATLVLVLAYLVNVDPRRVDVGFRSLSIGLAYFVANILTIHSGGFYANPFQLVWLVVLSSYGEWRSEWFVYMICPLVAGLFGAMSHEYIDFTSTRNRNRTLHMRRSFFSLNELNAQSTNQIGTPNNQTRCCSRSASQPQQQQYHSMHQMAEIRAANGKRGPNGGANVSRSISIDSASSSVYSLVVLGDEQIARPSGSTIGTSNGSKRSRASDMLRPNELHSEARRSEFDSNFFISASPNGI